MNRHPGSKALKSFPRSAEASLRVYRAMRLGNRASFGHKIEFLNLTRGVGSDLWPIRVDPPDRFGRIFLCADLELSSSSGCERSGAFGRNVLHKSPPMAAISPSVTALPFCATKVTRNIRRKELATVELLLTMYRRWHTNVYAV